MKSQDFKPVDCVVTAYWENIPLATQVAYVLNARFCYVDEKFVIKDAKVDEKTLICINIMDNALINALVNACKKAKMQVKGVFSIVGYKIEDVKCKYLLEKSLFIR